MTLDKKVTPYKDSSLNKKEQVEKMFDTISGNYDGLNRVISFGIDIKWRKKVLKLVSDKNPKTVLDIATGTGDLAILMTNTSAEKIIGLDISAGMLEVGRNKIKAKNLSNQFNIYLCFTRACNPLKQYNRLLFKTLSDFFECSFLSF